MRRHRVVLAKRGQEIDLEYTMFVIEEGKTYLDDGTTVFSVYIDAGLKSGAFEETSRWRDTIIVTHPDA
jgi:hypothetical protein